MSKSVPPAGPRKRARATTKASIQGELVTSNRVKMAKNVRVGDLILFDYGQGQRLGLVTGGYRLTTRTWKFQVTCPPGIAAKADHRLPQSVESRDVQGRYSPRK